MSQAKTEDDEDDFWQRFVLCEEDRLASIARSGEQPTATSFRWFRSSSVIDLVRYRQLKIESR